MLLSVSVRERVVIAPSPSVARSMASRPETAAIASATGSDVEAMSDARIAASFASGNSVADSLPTIALTRVPSLAIQRTASSPISLSQNVTPSRASTLPSFRAGIEA